MKQNKDWCKRKKQIKQVQRLLFLLRLA
jgi:hypothetical protein